MQPFLGSHALGWIAHCNACLSRISANRFEVFNEALERIRTAVEDQIFSQFPFFVRYFGVGGDVSRVDDRHVQTSLDGVIQHHTVQNRAGDWFKTK